MRERVFDAPSQAPRDQAPASERKKGPGVRMIPVSEWLGDGENPGIVDLDPETRAEVIRQGWDGPPEWSDEDERRWNLNQS